MQSWSLTQLSDGSLSRGLAASVARERESIALTLAHIAEFDARKLYLPAAYPTMHSYLLGELHLSEDAAYKRLRAARTAYSLPVLFDMVADSRLHLSAIVMLSSHLTPGNAAELLAAAAHRTKAQIEQLLAERFPKADVPTQLHSVGARTAVATEVEAPAPDMASPAPEPDSARAHSLAPGPVAPLNNAALAEPSVPLPLRPRVTPLAPERFALQVTLTRSTHDKLRRAQELLSHAVPSGDIAEVLDRALDALIVQLEKRRFAATSRPGPRRRAKSARHVPAHVRRAVHARDGDRCTFVSESGRRCSEKRFLEFDHVHPVARGGEATIENTRLRCRAHNQRAAERTYGAGFMREKREAVRAQSRASRMTAARCRRGQESQNPGSSIAA